MTQRYKVWISELLDLEENEQLRSDETELTVVVKEADYLKLVADYDKLTEHYEELQDQLDEI